MTRSVVGSIRAFQGIIFVLASAAALQSHAVTDKLGSILPGFRCGGDERPCGELEENLLAFPDTRALSLELAFPRPEMCVLHSAMVPVDDLTSTLSGLTSVETAFSLTSAIKQSNSHYQESSPRWKVLPRNQYEMVRSLTPIPVYSGLLDADCGKLWVEVHLQADSVRLKEIVPGLLRRTISPSATNQIGTVLDQWPSQDQPWVRSRLGTFSAQVVIVVKALGSDVFERGVVDAIGQATDELFYLPGVDRSWIRSLITPGIRSLKVRDWEEGGRVIAGGIRGKRMTHTDRFQLAQAVSRSPGAQLLVSDDRRRTVVLAPLIMAAEGKQLDALFVAERLQEILRVLNIAHASTAHFDGAVILGEVGGDAPKCDSRSWDCISPTPRGYIRKSYAPDRDEAK